MAENWRYGEITEDKKLPVRFLDADGNPILLSTLYGYGIKIFTSSETLVECGVNIAGYTDTLLVPVNTTTITVAMEGSLIENFTSSKKIYALTTIIIVDPDMPDGYFTDHSETVPLVYEAIRATKPS